MRWTVRRSTFAIAANFSCVIIWVLRREVTLAPSQIMLLVLLGMVGGTILPSAGSTVRRHRGGGRTTATRQHNEKGDSSRRQDCRARRRRARRFEQVATEWSWGGLVCDLSIEARPPWLRQFRVPGTITPLIDIRLDQGRLPDHLRAVPRPTKP